MGSEMCIRDRAIRGLRRRKRKLGYPSHPTPPSVVRTPSLVCFSPLDFVTYAVIEDNIIRDCGLLDFEFDDGQNGEGVCEY